MNVPNSAVRNLRWRRIHEEHCQIVGNYDPMPSRGILRHQATVGADSRIVRDVDIYLQPQSEMREQFVGKIQHESQITPQISQSREMREAKHGEAGKKSNLTNTYMKQSS